MIEIYLRQLIILRNLRAIHPPKSYHSLSTAPAINVVPKPSTAMMAKNKRRLTACAINPISGGPARKPINPMEDTAAIATPGGIVFDLPARPYTMGTTDDTPKPTNIKPTAAGYKYGNATAINKPVEMTTPLICSMRLTPYFVIRESPPKRPAAIIPIKHTL